MAKQPPFSSLIAKTGTSAVHLEMRDAYTPIAEMCARAFEAVWKRAIPHADYRPA
ncbi:MAG: hypothetical protein ACLPQY_02390 [Streptosporangiaceae bacterium]